jgi:branched-chain amino acid transport system ATP-binding protein
VSPAPLLEARGLSSGYGGVEIVRDLALEIRPGEVVALLGANGAGKTTTLLTLAGVLKPLGGEVCYKGSKTTAPLYKRARNGIAFVPEERSVFPKLTTRQNLAVGHADFAKATAVFPELEQLASRRAGLLSGGEQQMLTLGRAARPAARRRAVARPRTEDRRPAAAGRTRGRRRGARRAPGGAARAPGA